MNVHRFTLAAALIAVPASVVKPQSTLVLRSSALPTITGKLRRPPTKSGGDVVEPTSTELSELDIAASAPPRLVQTSTAMAARASQGHRVWVGVGTGLVAGAVVGAIYGARIDRRHNCSEGPCIATELCAGAGAAIGALVGGMVAELLPAHRFHATRAHVLTGRVVGPGARGWYIGLTAPVR